MEIQDNISKAIEFYRTRYLTGEERKKMHERRIGFVQGAEWKDQQFKEYLETHKQPVLASETDDTIVGYSIDVDEIINEFFKEE